MRQMFANVCVCMYAHIEIISTTKFDDIRPLVAVYQSEYIATLFPAVLICSDFVTIVFPKLI